MVIKKDFDDHVAERDFLHGDLTTRWRPEQIRPHHRRQVVRRHFVFVRVFGERIQEFYQIAQVVEVFLFFLGGNLKFIWFGFFFGGQFSPFSIEWTVEMPDLRNLRIERE